MVATHRRQIATILAGIGFSLLIVGSSWAQVPPQNHNKKILAAIEPFERIAETARGGDANAAAKAFKIAKAQRATTRALVPKANAARFDKLFGNLESAVAKGDLLSQSLHALELYKLLVSALDPAALRGPVQQVHLLDYIGFRISTLLRFPTPDWEAIAATAKEASGYWATIREQVTDSKLRAKMDKVQQDLALGAERHDAALTRASAEQDLDLVDELEHYFSRKSRRLIPFRNEKAVPIETGSTAPPQGMHTAIPLARKFGAAPVRVLRQFGDLR